VRVNKAQSFREDVYWTKVTQKMEAACGVIRNGDSMLHEVIQEEYYPNW
jgi:hypothetical protein